MTTNELDTVDTSYTSTDNHALFTAFFAAKSAKDLEGAMRFFSSELITYTDATLGWDPAGYDALRQLFNDYMPKWGEFARSYPTRIYGQGNRVVVDFVDSPELFGSEVRALGLVDLVDGKIVRWIDYWDGRVFPTALYHQLRTSPLPTPVLIRPLCERLPEHVPPAKAGLGNAFSRGYVDQIVATLATDAVFADHTLNLTLTGRAAVARFLTLVVDHLPYGSGSIWSDSISADDSGGEDWAASAQWPGVQGVMAIGRNRRGEVERLASIYDGRLCQDSQLTAILIAAIVPNE